METNNVPSIENLVAEARTDGITDPVIIYLDRELPAAHAIYQELHGKQMESRQIGPNTIGAIEKLSRSDASRLVRQHCSKAGILMANFLDQSLSIECGSVSLWGLNSQVEIVTDNRYLKFYVIGYEEIGCRFRQSRPKTTKASSLYLLEFDYEDPVAMCGTWETVQQAGLLTLLAANRKGWVFRQGRWVVVEAFDSDLAAELLRHKSKPDVIAETLRALRKMGPDKDRWLMSVLWGRRPLRPLARRVEHELTGQ
jgi:hypothetical protein